MSRRPKFTTFRNRKSSNERSRERGSPGGDFGRRQGKSVERSYGGCGNLPSTSFSERNEQCSGRQFGSRGHRRAGPRRKGGHPPELRGREIGMFYRNRSLMEKSKTKDEPSKAPKCQLEIQLDSRKEQEIKDLLNLVRTSYPEGGSGFQIRHEMPSSPSLEKAQVKLESNDEYISVFCGNKMKESSVDQLKASTSHVKTESYDFLDDCSNMEESCDDYVIASTSHVKSECCDLEDDWEIVEREPKVKATPLLKSNLAQCDKSSKTSCRDQYQNIKDSVFKRKFLQSITESIEDKLKRILRSQWTSERNPQLDQKLRDSLLAKKDSPKYREMLAFREKLPAYKMIDEILDLIHKNQVIVVSGETGCGKTTQVAQFILDDQILQNKGSTCHIVCTQPRRISATSVAQRVADERNEVLGAESVGYQIRLEKALPAKQGSVLFCTTGVLLQRMQTDPALCEISHLVLDEIHERDIVCDFVITLLRDVIAKRPDLKLILMSATLNADHFSKYFNNCPRINIPGFTFPVEELYLEDVLEITQFKFPRPRVENIQKYNWKKFTRAGKEALNKEQNFSEYIEPFVRNMSTQKYSHETRQALLNSASEDLNCELIAKLILHICTNKPDGAILVFLPGWTDISKLNKTLVADKFFSTSRFLIIPLHSMMPTTVQRSVFDRPPPGVRKIILATNIAETSITIDDVVYVIDTGKIKMKQYDVQSDIQTLLPEWVSLANAKQRKGRAGRVKPGVCYHLYSRAREMTFSYYPLPEMLRSRLEEVILTAKIQQVGSVKKFLMRVMDPPNPQAVDISLKLLYTMNALDDKENLTPLGYHLAKLPLDPQTGKMILLGALFSCVDPIFSIAASLSFKAAFHTPMGKEKEVDVCKLHLSNGSKSDHLLLSDVFLMWEEAGARGLGANFCWNNFLSENTLTLLKDMKQQFGRYLYDMKFLSSANPKAPEANVNSHNRSLVKAIICAGLYPNVAFVHSAKVFKNGVRQKISTMDEKKVAIHPRSINAQTSDFESPFIVYHLKLKSSQIYLHDSTVVYPMPLLFFGEDLRCFVENGVDMVSVNKYIRFSCKTETANLIKELKRHMSTVLEDRVCHPEAVKWSEHRSKEYSILRAIVELIAYEDKQIMDGYVYSDYDSDD